MAPTDVVVPMPPTSPRTPETPPSSPTLPASEQLTTKDARQFLELLKTLQATQTVSAQGGATLPVKTEEISGDKQHVAARATKLEFKTVSEM